MSSARSCVFGTSSPWNPYKTHYLDIYLQFVNTTIRF